MLGNLQMENFINPSNFTESLPEGDSEASDKAQIPEIFKAESPVVVKSQQVEVAEPPKKKDKGLLTSTDLKCQICKKTFEKRRYLMDHLRRVHNSAIHKVRQGLQNGSKGFSSDPGLIIVLPCHSHCQTKTS